MTGRGDIELSVEWLVARDVLQRIRQQFPHALIVIGGEHVTACREYSLETCPAVDAGVLGEGEVTIVDLVNAYSSGADLSQVRGIVYRANGAIVTTEHRPRVRDIDEIPRPDWSLFPIEAYIDNAFTHGANLGRCMPILASRGVRINAGFARIRKCGPRSGSHESQSWSLRR